MESRMNMAMLFHTYMNLIYHIKLEFEGWLLYNHKLTNKCPDLIRVVVSVNVLG